MRDILSDNGCASSTRPTQRRLDFVAAFVDPNSLGSLRATCSDLERQRRLAYDLPWAHAVLRVLELDDSLKQSEHVRGFIAQRIGISNALEDECLSALAHAAQIRRRQVCTSSAAPIA